VTKTLTAAVLLTTPASARDPDLSSRSDTKKWNWYEEKWSCSLTWVGDTPASPHY
jgi:hypothetical protein